MGVMVILLGISLIVGIGFLVAFIWSVKSGQFDDDYSPAHKIFFDDPQDFKDNKKEDNNIESKIKQP